jgi:cation diffusion facilitator CzcD-associated flavoprotein CzcO
MLLLHFGLMAWDPLNRAVLPKIAGINSFEGTSFHTSHWNHKCDLTEKRVAVIGTGASAIQVIPNIASSVKELHVFQRSAAWVLHKPDRKMKAWGEIAF